MSIAARCVRLDMRSLRPYARYIAVPITVMAVAVTVFSRSAYAVIPAVAAFAVLLGPQYLFGNDERGRLDTLYAVLSLRRSQVVTGRYASCVGLILICSVAGLVLAGITAVFLGAGFDWRAGIMSAGFALFPVLLILAALLPLYFAFSFSRARALGATAPGVLFLLAVLVVWLFPDVLRGAVATLEHVNLAWLAVILMVTSLLALMGSWRLSVWLYGRRDL